MLEFNKHIKIGLAVKLAALVFIVIMLGINEILKIQSRNYISDFEVWRLLQILIGATKAIALMTFVVGFIVSWSFIIVGLFPETAIVARLRKLLREGNRITVKYDPNIPFS